jgi:4'-phosphopantetheinyl transferase
LLKAYITFIDRDLTEREYRSLLPYVSPEKRERIMKYRNFADKQRSLLGDLLARSALAELLSIRPEELAFSTSRYGKPELRDHRNIHFNISHSGKYVVSAVSDEPVGIDVEQVKEKDFMKIAERFFSQDEKSYIENSQPVGAKAAAFAEIWTKKEAFIKREGLGLALPLPSFCVLDMSGAEFHCVFDDGDAVCYVCSGTVEKPEVMRLTASGFAVDFIKKHG